MHLFVVLPEVIQLLDSGMLRMLRHNFCCFSEEKPAAARRGTIVLTNSENFRDLHIGCQCGAPRGSFNQDSNSWLEARSLHWAKLLRKWAEVLR